MTRQSVSEMQAELELIQREARDELSRRVLSDPSRRRARSERRLSLERAIAAAAGEEYAEPIAFDVALGDEWHLLSGFMRETALVCGDTNSASTVILEFAEVIDLRFDGLAAEPFEQHLLYGKGLDVVGFHRVQGSAWLRELYTAMACHPAYRELSWASLDHYIVRGKRGQLACIARGWTRTVLHEPITHYRGGRRLSGQAVNQATLFE